LTRQSESDEVLEFLKKHKLTVVETMEYIGSSFKGKNFENDTAMRKFVTAVTGARCACTLCAVSVKNRTEITPPRQRERTSLSVLVNWRSFAVQK
jgi:hypothetical protein